MAGWLSLVLLICCPVVSSVLLAHYIHIIFIRNLYLASPQQWLHMLQPVSTLPTPAAILPVDINVTVPWSVCLSVCLSLLCIVVSWQKISTEFLSYDSPTSLPDSVKIWLTSVDPFLPIFCPKVIHPLLTWASEANCGRLVRGSAMVTMESL